MAGESIQIGVAAVVDLALSLALPIESLAVEVALPEEGIIVRFFRRDEARSHESIHYVAVVPLVSVSVFHMYEVGLST